MARASRVNLRFRLLGFRPSRFLLFDAIILLLLPRPRPRGRSAENYMPNCRRLIIFHRRTPGRRLLKSYRSGNSISALPCSTSTKNLSVGPSRFFVDGKMQYMFAISRHGLFDFGLRQINIVDGKMQYLFDENGRRYHSIADFAEALAAKMPGYLKVVFFTNSGTEANELAMMMAKLYTGFHLP